MPPPAPASPTKYCETCAPPRARWVSREVGWDATLVTWLNSTLLDNVDRDLLEEYVEMLRNLRLSCLPIMEASTTPTCCFVHYGRGPCALPRGLGRGV